AGGGGGGSSYAAPGTRNASFWLDSSGTPSVTITYAAAASITLTKQASPTSGPAPLEVAYAYTLVNEGTDTLFHVSVADDHCSAVTLQGGDVDGDQLLDPGETWTFGCSRSFSSPGTYTNTATARGTNTATGLPVSSNAAQATVTVGGATV
ncbi:MAG TPA: hypothetical protein VG455_08335, partial [Acidimicrobiales bacterium]|nr:hypothetical protein [Acidimicrobiales bacterium]